jgi:hypothetical protein
MIIFLLEVQGMRKRILAAVLCSGLVMAVPAFAQQSATLLTKSGERISGELVDMGGSDFTMRVNGQERRVAIAEVAVVDFAGSAQSLPAEELNRLTAGQNVIVLKDGQTFEGKLYDVGGTSPLRITFTTSGQQRDFTSTEVGRIYLDRPTAGTSGSQSGGTPASPSARTVQVSAQRQWTPTGLVVQRGEVVQFSSSGEVRLSADAADTSRVPGREDRRSAKFTLPSTWGGALIGRVGNGQPFGIGDQASVPMPGAGELFLGVNDDVFTDNSGEFSVTVTGRARTAVPRR